MGRYDTNYDDERLVSVETEKQEALTDVENTYDGMINESDSFYQAQIDATKEYADKQSQIQQEQTDFALEQIEQQKEQAEKDYTKEQSGAYVDWQKQSNQYGAEAEKMAASGLSNTGYSETAQVSMYNTYQNRVATARDVYARAVLNYDNAMKDARLQNNAALAEIAYNALMQELELSLAGFQYKNSLVLEKANKKLEVGQIYHGYYQDVLDQINTENALNEQARQHDAEMAARAAALEQEQAQFEAQMTEEKRQFDAQMAEEQRQFDKSNSGSKVTGGISNGAKGAITGGSGVITGTTSAGEVKVDKNTSRVETPYFRGYLNLDGAIYGYMENGYQPKGINGHGKLTDSGDTYTFTTEVKYGDQKGEKKTVTQKVWKAEDGTLWYWEGRENKYLRFAVEGGGGRSFE